MSTKMGSFYSYSLIDTYFKDGREGSDMLRLMADGLLRQVGYRVNCEQVTIGDSLGLAFVIEPIDDTQE